MKVVADGEGRLHAIGKRLAQGKSMPSRSACWRSAAAAPSAFRDAIERAIRTAEGTTIWYLRVIHHIAQNGDVWTLDIQGEEWGEVDFPEDVEAARALVDALGPRPATSPRLKSACDTSQPGKAGGLPYRSPTSAAFIDCASSLRWMSR